MATFFGTVQGGRGKATRLGHSGTGLHVTAQSYSGSVIVELYCDAQTGDEHCRIAVGQGSTATGSVSLYRGPIRALFSDQTNLGR